MSTPGYVYVVRQGSTDNYKIGYAADLKTRLSQLQTASADPLTVHLRLLCDNPDVMETRLHKAFHKKLIRGEWFKLSAKDLDLIRDVCGFSSTPSYKSKLWTVYKLSNPVDEGLDALPIVPSQDKLLKAVMFLAMVAGIWDGSLQGNTEPRYMTQCFIHRGRITHVTGYIWKQDNNGDTFVAFPRDSDHVVVADDSLPISSDISVTFYD
jgi:hypothetical protein